MDGRGNNESHGWMGMQFQTEPGGPSRQIVIPCDGVNPGAAMFSAEGKVLQPSEVLYKKPLLVERGRFRPVTASRFPRKRRPNRARQPRLGSEGAAPGGGGDQQRRSFGCG